MHSRIRDLRSLASRTFPDRSLIAVLLLFLGLAVLHALVVPPLEPTDERAHLSYALELRNGDLPRIETPVRVEILRRSRVPGRNTIWVANHPPLFYAIAALVVGDVEEADDVPEAVLKGRMLSIAFATMGLCFVFWTVREITGPGSRLPQVVVGLTVVVPHFTHVMALLYNDAAAFFAGAGVLYFATRSLTRGPSRGRYVALIVFACAAACIRLSSAIPIATALVALALACYRSASGSRRRRGALAFTAVGGVLAAVALTSGWFYLRNYELYGEISGVATLFRRFDRAPRGPVLAMIADRSFWWHLVEQLWGYYAGAKTLLPTTLAIPSCVGLAALVGSVVDAFAKGRAVTRSQLAIVLSSPKAAAVLTFAGFSCVTVLSVCLFYSMGGSPHGRYMIPALWCFAAVAAIGLLRLGRRATGFGLTALLISHLLTLDSYIARAHVLRGEELEDILFASFERPPGVATHTVVVMLLAVVAGLLGILESLGGSAVPARTEEEGAATGTSRRQFSRSGSTGRSSQCSAVGSGSSEPSAPGTR